MNDEWNGPTGQSCKNCFFWIDTACRRYPPRLVALSVKFIRSEEGERLQTEIGAKAPDTASDCWCGEWKGRE